jgi:hypothetical protein
VLELLEKAGFLGKATGGVELGHVAQRLIFLVAVLAEGEVHV